MSTFRQLVCALVTGAVASAMTMGAARAEVDPGLEAFLGDSPPVQAQIEKPRADPAPTSLPARIHAGRVVKAELSADALPWVDMDKALAARAFVPGETPEAESVITREPGAGRAYALVTVELETGRSFGKTDYALAADGVSWPGLAMRVGDDPYDPRHWQVEGGGAIRQAVVVYEIPPDTRQATMIMTLPVALSEPRVSLRFEPDARPLADTAELVADDAPAVDAAEPVDDAPAEAPAEEKPAAAKPAEEPPARRPARSDWW